MNLELEKRSGVVIAHVRETQIGADSADDFRSRIQSELPERAARVAIDLSAVDFMDSSGLGALVSLLKGVRPDGELALYGVRPGVKEILRLTHLDTVFACHPDEGTAVTALAEKQAS